MFDTNNAHSTIPVCNLNPNSKFTGINSIKLKKRINLSLSTPRHIVTGKV